MCDYSLQSVASRPAKVGDKLTTWDFGTGTIGFAAAEDTRVAVCVLPGTELAFSKPVECGPGDLMGWGRKTLSHQTGDFSADQQRARFGASRRAGISGRRGCPPNQPVGRSGGSGASVAGTAYDCVGKRTREARRVHCLSIRAATPRDGRPPREGPTYALDLSQMVLRPPAAALAIGLLSKSPTPLHGRLRAPPARASCNFDTVSQFEF